MLWNIWHEGYIVYIICAECEARFHRDGTFTAWDTCPTCQTPHGVEPYALVTQDGPIEADTFDEAVEKHRRKNGFVNSLYQKDDKGWYALDEDLRLHPTEEEARKATEAKAALLRQSSAKDSPPSHRNEPN